jgi:hypothetical protein
MKIELAIHIANHEPWRWSEVWDEADQILRSWFDTAWHADGYGCDPRDIDRVEHAANLVRELVPLTGLRCTRGRPGHEDSECSPGPHGQDVLSLYVRAVRLASNQWREMLVLGGFHDGSPNLDAGLWPLRWDSFSAKIYEDGTVECGPHCPPLPELR